jgi:predicted Zn-dependent protease
MHGSIIARARVWLMVALSVGLMACAGPGANRIGPAEGSAGAAGKIVYLVPFGDFPRDALAKLGAHLEQRFQVEVHNLPRVSLTKQMIDYARRQVPAQEFFDVLEPKRLQLLRDSSGIIIGLTTYDMYIRGIDWEFAFAAREPPALAVVSTWRMDETNYGKRADETLLSARLRKMVSKTVATLLLGMKESEDPDSGLYGGIRSLADLDRMAERF